jgi:long-chain acyl-CoA synthetase
VLAAACAEATLSIPVHTRLPEIEEAGELPEFGDDQPALVLYTSGTTARPKGVVHSHATLLATARGMNTTGIAATEIMIVAVPLMHGTGLMATTLPGLLAGATVVMTPAFEPGEVLDTIERHRCTFGLGLPAMMQFMAVEQERRPRDVASLRIWLAGGDAVPVSLQERFQRIFGIALQEGYAMTESIVIAWNRVDAIRTGSLGTPAEDVRIRVVDLSGHPVPDGQSGELEVHSPCNFLEYWNDEPATAAALRDGWLLTGDLGWRDAEGYFWFAGRRKEVIIRGGSNISPQEVEEALYQHPAVMEVGVIGMPDPIFNEQVVACVSLREGRSAHADELIDFARTRLADYKLPSRIVFLPALPKGITGKVHRRSLKEMAAATAAGAPG